MQLKIQKHLSGKWQDQQWYVISLSFFPNFPAPQAPRTVAWGRTAKTVDRHSQLAVLWFEKDATEAKLTHGKQDAKKLL
jgi:hypothetical protein